MPLNHLKIYDNLTRRYELALAYGDFFRAAKLREKLLQTDFLLRQSSLFPDALSPSSSSHNEDVPF